MRKSSTRLAAVGTIAGLVLLSACGSDSNDSNSSATTVAPTATDAMSATTDAMADKPGTIVDVAVAGG